jgi:hypothetical protein
MAASGSVESKSGMPRKAVAEAPFAPVIPESVPVMLRKTVVEVPVIPVTVKEAAFVKKAQ